MIEVTFNDLIKAKSGLEKIVDQKLPFKDAVRFARFIKQVNNELSTYHSIVIKYCDENGTKSIDGIYTFKDVDKSKKEIEELGSDKIKFDFNKFKLPDWIELASNDIEGLEPFIDFGET